MVQKLDLSATAKVQRIENLPPSGISIVRDAKTVFMVVYILYNRSGGPGHEGIKMSFVLILSLRFEFRDFSTSGKNYQHRI